jgi:hypothetical protein
MVKSSPNKTLKFVPAFGIHQTPLRVAAELSVTHHKY